MPRADIGLIPLSDGLPADEWQRVRSGQVALGVSPEGRGRVIAVSSSGGAYTPLTGRPGRAALVAGALNTISSGPNTSAPVDIPAEKGRVQGSITRGPGRDFRAEGRVSLGRLTTPRVGATGTLDPSTGRPELSASDIRGRGIGLPPRVRVYNTPTGELDVTLSGPVRFGPFTLAEEGTYVIGTPDRGRK